MVDVLDLSEYIIYYSNCKGYGISCLKLQKVLYLLQAEWLVKKGEKLFDDKIIAWDIGVVVPKVYDKYIRYAGMDILTPNKTKKDDLALRKFQQIIGKRDIQLINSLIDYFKGYNAAHLTTITQHQKPFTSVYSYYQENEVTCDSIRNYFLSDEDYER